MFRLIRDIFKKKAYDYQLMDKGMDFEQGVKLLKGKIRNPITIDSINNNIPSIVDEIFLECNNYNYKIHSLAIKKDDFNTFFSHVDYPQKFPNYYNDNIYEKALEHYLCHKLLRLKFGDIFIDIASENSPVGVIFSELSGCISYSQDIMYERGIHGNKIGSDASSLPFCNSFFDGAIATCSIEHFENDSDIRFISEMERVLVPGGKIIIAPLYLYSIEATQTDPCYSVPGNVHFDRNATVFCSKNWGNRHGRFYSPHSLFERIIKPNKKMRFQIYHVQNIADIHESAYCRFILVGTKI